MDEHGPAAQSDAVISDYEPCKNRFQAEIGSRALLGAGARI